MSRFELPNVRHDRLELLVRESRSECRHLAGLAVPDPRNDLGVGELSVHQLRPFAGLASALEMTPATGSRKERVDVEASRASCTFVCGCARRMLTGLHPAGLVGSLCPHARGDEQQAKRHGEALKRAAGKAAASKMNCAHSCPGPSYVIQRIRHHAP